MSDYKIKKSIIVFLIIFVISITNTLYSQNSQSVSTLYDLGQDLIQEYLQEKLQDPEAEICVEYLDKLKELLKNQKNIQCIDNRISLKEPMVFEVELNQIAYYKPVDVVETSNALSVKASKLFKAVREGTLKYIRDTIEGPSNNPINVSDGWFDKIPQLSDSQFWQGVDNVSKNIMLEKIKELKLDELTPDQAINFWAGYSDNYLYSDERETFNPEYVNGLVGVGRFHSIQNPNDGGICGDFSAAMKVSMEQYQLARKEKFPNEKPMKLNFYTYSFVVSGAQHVVAYVKDENNPRKLILVNYNDTQVMNNHKSAQDLTNNIGNLGVEARLYMINDSNQYTQIDTVTTDIGDTLNAVRNIVLVDSNKRLLENINNATTQKVGAQFNREEIICKRGKIKVKDIAHEVSLQHTKTEADNEMLFVSWSQSVLKNAKAGETGLTILDGFKRGSQKNFSAQAGILKSTTEIAEDGDPRQNLFLNLAYDQDNHFLLYSDKKNESQVSGNVGFHLGGYGVVSPIAGAAKQRELSIDELLESGELVKVVDNSGKITGYKFRNNNNEFYSIHDPIPTVKVNVLDKNGNTVYHTDYQPSGDGSASARFGLKTEKNLGDQKIGINTNVNLTLGIGSQQHYGLLLTDFREGLKYVKFVPRVTTSANYSKKFTDKKVEVNAIVDLRGAGNSLAASVKYQTPKLLVYVNGRMFIGKKDNILVPQSSLNAGAQRSFGKIVVLSLDATMTGKELTYIGAGAKVNLNNPKKSGKK